MLQTILKIQKNGTLPPHHTLQQWLTPSNKRHMQHEWYHDTRIEEIYNNKENEIIQYFSKKITYYNLQCNMDSKIKTKTIPQRATPIKQRDNNFTCYPKHDLEATLSKVPMTLKKRINNLLEWKRLLIQSATELKTKEPLIEIIKGKRDIIIAYHERPGFSQMIRAIY